MRNYFFMAAFLMHNSFSHAGFLVTESTIVAMENTSANANVFAVIAKGGSGPCVSSGDKDVLIYFPVSEAENIDVHNRAYSMLLSAMATKSKVTIYNYKDDSCLKAVGVRILNK